MIQMSCIKKCKCEECEMLMENEPMTFIEMRGLSEKRATLVGVKCMYTGMYAETTNKLKKSTLSDSLIFIE